MPRFAALDDAAVLAAPLPLTLAQEIVAVEAGCPSWPALVADADDRPAPAAPPPAVARLGAAVPILFVRDVAVSAAWYRDRLGFRVDFLHGRPPFYGAVARDAATLHLRHVAQPPFAALAETEEQLIAATIAVAGIKPLFAELDAAGVPFAQRLVHQAWGGLDFQVADPDGNRVHFVEPRR